MTFLSKYFVAKELFHNRSSYRDCNFSGRDVYLNIAVFDFVFLPNLISEISLDFLVFYVLPSLKSELTVVTG